jgi:spore coat polysaccharide biosynthesis protein SpsF
MGSSRLPGKVMRTLIDRSVLAHVIARVKAIPSVDEVIVATTELEQDQMICDEATLHGCIAFRGSEEDVLARYYFAALNVQADLIMRVTSDCPLLDPEIAETIIQLYHQQHADYASNTQERTFPRGLDTEVFSFRVLKEAFEESFLPHYREHVTPFLYMQPVRYRLSSLSSAIDYSQYRWTLDTPEDWLLITEIYKRLYKPDHLIPWAEVAALMEAYPHLKDINAHIEQKKLSE